MFICIPFFQLGKILSAAFQYQGGLPAVKTRFGVLVTFPEIDWIEDALESSTQTPSQDQDPREAPLEAQFVVQHLYSLRQIGNRCFEICKIWCQGREVGAIFAVWHK